jgi:hypothetical protein
MAVRYDSISPALNLCRVVRASDADCIGHRWAVASAAKIGAVASNSSLVRVQTDPLPTYSTIDDAFAAAHAELKVHNYKNCWALVNEILDQEPLRRWLSLPGRGGSKIEFAMRLAREDLTRLKPHFVAAR